MSYYFDYLPAHPKPVFPESQSGYMLRYAKLNDLTTIGQIKELFFPETDVRVVRTLDDFPLKTLDSFIDLVHCTKENILATSFYYLSEFFGRSTNGQAVSRFLNNAISRTLRFCPICVKEYHRYSLLWRFTPVIGCHIHGCYLENYCPFCFEDIPVFPSSLQFCKCPNCGKDLGDTQPRFLANILQVDNLQISEDLEFLLQPKEYGASFVEQSSRIGCFLNQRRVEMGRGEISILSNYGFSQEKLIQMEGGKINAHETKVGFIDYFKYVRTLNTTFKDIHRYLENDLHSQTLIIIKDNEERRAAIDFQECKKRVIEVINSPNQPQTMEEISRIAKISHSRFYCSSELYELLPLGNKGTLENIKRKEAKYYLQVLDIVNKLLEENIEVNFQIVRRRTFISTYYLFDNPKIHQLILEYRIKSIKKIEESLQLQIASFINECRKANSIPTIRDIENYLQLSRTRLRRYPMVAYILDNLKNNGAVSIV